MENVLENNFGFNESAAADELRQRKAASVSEDAPLSKREEGGSNGAGDQKNMSLRERIMSARREMDLKEKAKEKLTDKVFNPAKDGTGWLLRGAWLNLIDSFGLTLIYINTHIFLRWIFPDLFCKLGEEWMPKKIAPESGAKSVGGTAFGIVEVMGLLFLDILLVFIIFFIFAALIMIFESVFGWFGWLVEWFS